MLVSNTFRRNRIYVAAARYGHAPGTTRAGTARRDRAGIVTGTRTDPPGTGTGTARTDRAGIVTGTRTDPA